MRDPAAWAADHLTDPTDIDCTMAVMLKILDGKCKMAEGEKAVMAVLYDAVKSRSGRLLDADDHALIARAREAADEALVMEIYERRLMVETMISRPVMKAYKARLRQAGILGDGEQAD
ncbi:MAG: hypothetical protein EG825_00880 [Rhodocyclaceae bacterium]|nr:hypothetical protein [Rhodocyclaceae bacterium]